MRFFDLKRVYTNIKQFNYQKTINLIYLKIEFKNQIF